MAATLNPIIPRLDGESRLQITSVIRTGDHAPSLIFTGVIGPDAVKGMVLNPAIAVQNLHIITERLKLMVTNHCRVALAPPKEG